MRFPRGEENESRRRQRGQGSGSGGRERLRWREVSDPTRERGKKETQAELSAEAGKHRDTVVGRK